MCVCVCVKQRFLVNIKGNCKGHNGTLFFNPWFCQQAWVPLSPSGSGWWEMWSDCWRWCGSGRAWREHEPILTDAGLLLRLRSAITQDINTVCWGQAREPRASGNGKHCAAWCRPQKLWQAATAIAWLWEGDDWIWSMRNILRKTETHAWMRCADMIDICKWTKSTMSLQKLSEFNGTCVTFPTYTLVNMRLPLFISNSTIPSLCLPPPRGGNTSAIMQQDLLSTAYLGRKLRWA